MVIPQDARRILVPGQTSPTQVGPTLSELFEIQRRVSRENLGLIANSFLPRFLQNDLQYLARAPELYLEDDVKMVYVVNDALAGDSDAQGNPLFILTSVSTLIVAVQSTTTVYTVPNNRKTRLDLTNVFVNASTNFSLASRQVQSCYVSV